MINLFFNRVLNHLNRHQRVRSSSVREFLGVAGPSAGSAGAIPGDTAGFSSCKLGARS